MPQNCAAIVIAAKHHELTKVKDTRGTTHTVGALRCRFEFRTDDWLHSVKTAMFCNGDALLHPEVADTAIAVLLDEDNECAVPCEVLMDTLPYSIGVWGVTDTGLRIVSRWLVFNAQNGCYTEGNAPEEPTPSVYEQLLTELDNKVNKVEGKVLSTHDYTTEDKEKLLSVEMGANKIIVEDSLESVSTTNALSAAQGKVLNDKVNAVDMTKAVYDTNNDGVVNKADDTDRLGGVAASEYAKKSSIPDKISQLENDKGYLTEHQDISSKVDKVDGKGLSTNDLTDELVGIINDNKQAIANQVVVNEETYETKRDAAVKLSEAKEYTDNKYKFTTISLPAANWTGDAGLYSQIVTVDGITEYSRIDLNPTVEQLAELTDAEVTLVAENADKVVTIYAINEKPTKDYTIQITVIEVLPI